MTNKLKIEQCVESLCRNGCAAVRATIESMEQDLANIELDGLGHDEQKQVLKELKAIMLIYERPCKI